MSIKGFILAGEGNAIVFELIVQLQEVQQVAADAVKLPNVKVAELSGADALHHGLKSRAIEVLAGKANVAEDFNVLDAVKVCELAQVAFLQRQAVFICLHVGGYADIQSSFGRFGYSNSMFSHNTRLLSIAKIVRAVHNML